MMMRISLLLMLLVAAAMPENSSALFWKDDEGEELFEMSPVLLEGGVPMAQLSNDAKLPLVGLGVEHLPQYMVPLMSASALQDDKRTRLFDTAHVTNNEPLLMQGLKQGMERLESVSDKVELHVITKVWYTHLGYHRTKISVQDSFQALRDGLDEDKVDLKVHILLQWPRCYDAIPWMNCAEEENTVAPHVQNAGPPPHHDKENAWKDSWKALEDMYTSQELPIASIGVSNFHMKDMQEMDKIARVHPHILQLSVWSLLYDPFLVDYCQRHNIHIQVFDAVDDILSDPEKAPNAFHHLMKVAGDLSKGFEDELTPTQVLLAWLSQHGISVIPGTTRLSELQENSALTVAAIPDLSDVQVETVAHCIEAFLSGDDLEKDIHVRVTFTAKSKDTFLYWQKPEGGEARVAFIPVGKSFNETTYPKHNFRLYDARNKDSWIDYQVHSGFGDHESYEAVLD